MSPLKSVLAALAALAATIAGLDVTGILPLLPPDLVPPAALKIIALAPGAAACLVHFANSFRANLDKYGLLILLAAGAMLCPSCAGVSVSLATPWGDASSVDGGPVSILIVPAK